MLVACAYDALDNQYSLYRPTEAGELIEDLQATGMFVTFNGTTFDLPVLEKAATVARSPNFRSKHLDLMTVIGEKFGRLISLDHMARNTLGEAKVAAGADIPGLPFKKYSGGVQG